MSPSEHLQASRPGPLALMQQIVTQTQAPRSPPVDQAQAAPVVLLGVGAQFDSSAK